MPEITDAQLTEYHQYKAIAPTPSEMTRKLEDAIKDNGKQRDEIRDLREKAKAIPPEGAVVLIGDEAKAHEAFKALGKTPEELGKLTGRVEELETKDAARTRQDAFAGAVKALGWPEDTVTTLLDMKSLDGALVEVKTEKVRDAKTGKDEDVSVPYVTLSGEGAKPQKFAEFASVTPQLKGIRTDAVASGEIGRSAPEQRGNPPGNVNKGATALERARAENERRAKAPNALRPAAATT